MPHKVYIVEDHPDVLLTYREFLGKMDGFEICGTANSAEAALDDRQLGEADVALIDVSLPGMSGIDLVRQLSCDYPNLPCLIVSGHSEDVYAHSAYEAGARGYVMKGQPFAMVEAIETVLQGELCYSNRVRRRLAL